MSAERVDAPMPEALLAYGACRGSNSVLFFPDERSSRRANQTALAICDSCPVLEECFQYAVDVPWLYGIWGGTTQMERGVRSTREIDWNAARKEALRLKDSGLTSEKVARKLGISNSSVRRYWGMKQPTGPFLMERLQSVVL